MRSLTEICGLRISVESYVAPKAPLQCQRCQCFGHKQRNCGYTPRRFSCGGSHFSGGCSTPREQPQCCGCGETTRRTTGTVLSGRRRRQLLQSRCPSVAERAPPQATLLLRKLRGQALCRADGPGRGVEPRLTRGRVVKATTLRPKSKSLSSAGHGIVKKKLVTN